MVHNLLLDVFLAGGKISAHELPHLLLTLLGGRRVSELGSVELGVRALQVELGALLLLLGQRLVLASRLHVIDVSFLGYVCFRWSLRFLRGPGW